MRDKRKLSWSKKENDWSSDYTPFFDMIRKFEDFMKYDWENKPTGFTNFRDYLSDGGFDPDTFTITVKKKENIYEKKI